MIPSMMRWALGSTCISAKTIATQETREPKQILEGFGFVSKLKMVGLGLYKSQKY